MSAFAKYSGAAMPESAGKSDVKKGATLRRSGGRYIKSARTHILKA